MKFLSIKYHNYRCFRDLKIDFETTKDKNISLVVAPNGGGKTEMLFSFWWVLYGFDFKKLKGKENTAYSLNSALYHKLQNSKEFLEYTCSIELRFEYDGREYQVTRSEKYSKTNSGISILPSVMLSFVDETTGADSLPIENAEDVDKILTRIIPPKILSGIIFDGERMKQLSSIDEDSKNAVEGVIKHITNEELFEMCKTELNELKDSISKELRKISKDGKNQSLNSIETQLANYEVQKTICEAQISGKKDSLEGISAELDGISRQLEQHRDSKVYEQQRKQLRLELEEKKDALQNAAENFNDDLWYGYMLIGEDLVNQVKALLQQENIPLDLTAEAVKSILSGERCICGRELCEHERAVLTELISKLPPVNINSTIMEMTRHAEIDLHETQSKILRSFKEVRDLEKSIGKKKEDIDHISTLITGGASEAITRLEKRNVELEAEKRKIKDEIDKQTTTLEGFKRLIAQLLERRNALANADESSRHLTKKDSYVRKCLKALEAIDEYNKRVSLQDINSRINSAYALLSEDYEKGKRLYIIQYDKEDKYGMVSYLQSQYDDLYDKYLNDGTITTYKSINLNEEEIKEKIILKIRESNSTGQSKINTLSFAKAILDYSSEVRDDDSTELSKSYPFLIDSPFTELDGGNLEMSSRNIHSFAEQIILMISVKSLAGVQDNIMPYVYSRYRLEKKEGESNSTLQEV
jgi:DNA sulfur modification protein DndD